jgi:formate hydrogenlyase transcriptional activator
MGLASVKYITNDYDFAPRYEALFGAFDSWRVVSDLKELMETLPSQLQPLVGFDYMSVLLKKESSAEPCWYVLDQGERPVLTVSREIPFEHPYMSQAFDHQQPAFAPGFQPGLAFSHSSHLFNDRGVQSGFAIPMSTEDRRLGALFFARKRIRPLSDEEERFLSLVADRVAIAIGDMLGTEPRNNHGSNSNLKKEKMALSDRIDSNFMFEEMVGSSDVLHRVLDNVMRVAPTDATVLITGESGTGKELVARAIHKRSRRSGRPFIRVNCAAIPPSLIASELFGYERGAFTGAVQRHLGRFEVANGGTIFLDEIGDIPAETQIALLRVLQEREIERIGGSQPIPVDVRVLAATNRDLKSAVAARKIRRDLYYRLNVFPVEIPPLRERLNDIPLLATHFIACCASKAGKEIRNIERQTLQWLQEHDWPGNIRELQNIVERAVILCDGDTLSVDKAWLQSETAETPDAPFVLSESLLHQEREVIEAALEESMGRISGPLGAANKLGIPRTTLESKIKSLRINKHRFKSAPMERRANKAS